jgi:hypothetical protein
MRRCRGMGELSILRRHLASSHLLSLEVLVKQVKGLLVGARGSSNSEHPLARLVVGGLGDGDTSTGTLANLRDLATCATDDAANHVGGDADVLGLDVFVVLGSIGGGSARARLAARVGGRGVTEVGAVAGAVVGAAAFGGVGRAVVGRGTASSTRDSDGGVVEDGAVATLFVVDEALANLPDSLLDAIGGALDLDNALGRLGEHLLLGDHADTRSVLDLLDLETLATDDGAHLVVGDEETDGWERISQGHVMVVDVTYGECWGWRRHRPYRAGERP